VAKEDTTQSGKGERLTRRVIDRLRASVLPGGDQAHLGVEIIVIMRRWAMRRVRALTPKGHESEVAQ
jgi:hypothetical protein